MTYVILSDPLRKMALITNQCLTKSGVKKEPDLKLQILQLEKKCVFIPERGQCPRSQNLQRLLLMLGVQFQDLYKGWIFRQQVFRIFWGEKDFLQVSFSEVPEFISF